MLNDETMYQFRWYIRRFTLHNLAGQLLWRTQPQFVEAILNEIAERIYDGDWTEFDEESTPETLESAADHLRRLNRNDLAALAIDCRNELLGAIDWHYEKNGIPNSPLYRIRY